ncbi:MAG: sigma-70 family RNA polymerase sigma factor [Oscillospiraceae bacterium]|nr:sigma-70 family RNA polymerase sigma factor [Oscillospiraceae bacterium]
MTDRELQALMKSSLNDGAKALYQQYAQYVYAIIFRILRDCGTREDVEDCFAETFAEVIQRFDSIREDHVKAYIGQAARNRALNYCRSLKSSRLHTMPLEDAQEPAEAHVETDTEGRLLQTELLRQVQALGEPDATIIVQKYYFNRKMADIAEMVGLTPHAAQVRCSRALKRLRTAMKDWR